MNGWPRYSRSDNVRRGYRVDRVEPEGAEDVPCARLAAVVVLGRMYMSLATISMEQGLLTPESPLMLEL